LQASPDAHDRARKLTRTDHITNVLHPQTHSKKTTSTRACQQA